MTVFTLPSGQRGRISKAISYGAKTRALSLIREFGDCVDPQTLQGDTYVAVVAIDGINKIVGTCSVGRNNNFSSEIFHLCVLEGYRGRGIAKRLVEHTLLNVTKPMVFVNINSSNEISKQVFKSQGFNHFFTYSKLNRNGENAMFEVYSKVTGQPYEKGV